MKLFTAEQIIEKQISILKSQIEQNKKNQESYRLILQGEMQAFQTTLANLEYLIAAETTVKQKE